MRPSQVLMLDEPWQMPLPAGAVMASEWLAQVAIGSAAARPAGSHAVVSAQHRAAGDHAGQSGADMGGSH